MDYEILTKSKGSVSFAFNVLGSNFEVTLIFTTKNGGFSTGDYKSLNLSPYVGDDEKTVKRNRRRVAKLLGMEDFITIQQVHGSDIVYFGKEKLRDIRIEHLDIKADSLITDAASIPIGVLTADCLPVLVVAEPGIVAAIHAGWRGLVEGVIERTIESLQNLGAQEFLFFFGPSICEKCYRVGEDVSLIIEERFKTGIMNIAENKYVSLKSIGFQILKQMGVADNFLDARDIDENKEKKVSSIAYNINDCTFENRNYYSYRRNKITGRQAGIITLRR
ncbi:MAG: polyphenol oxidase family protein [Actinobacteria bacterium]|nr:polyphenol oxidase family protein [Actinomycetota bacterium]